MWKIVALIIGVVVAYVVNEIIGEGKTQNIISITIGIIVALILWLLF